MRDRSKWVVGAALVLIGMTAWWYFRSPADPWVTASHPYSAECGEDCRPLTAPALTHGGPVRLMHDPAVDDAVAQWSDCLQSVLTCVDDTEGELAAVLEPCVSESACPSACKTAYRRQIDGGSGADDPAAAFEAVFLVDGGHCVPADGG